MTLSVGNSGDGVFLDGSRVTRGTARCMCDSQYPLPDGRDRVCEFPCWQRIGITATPCCPDCPPLPGLMSSAATSVPRTPNDHCFREDSPTEACELCGYSAEDHTGCDCENE